MTLAWENSSKVTWWKRKDDPGGAAGSKGWVTRAHSWGFLNEGPEPPLSMPHWDIWSGTGSWAGWQLKTSLAQISAQPAAGTQSVPSFSLAKLFVFSLPYGKHLSNSRVQLWRGRSTYNRTHQPLPGEGSPAGFVYKSLSTSAAVCAQGEWVGVCRGCGLLLTGMCCYLHSFGQDWLTTHDEPGASRSFQENSRTRFTPTSRLTFSKKKRYNI